MEETFLTPIIHKLVVLSFEEAKLLKGVHKEVKSLKDELEIIQPLLKDAETKSQSGNVSEATKAWMRQLTEEADRIEDVVDEYLYYVEEHHHQIGFAGCLHKTRRFVTALRPRHRIASEIQDIKESLSEIKERGRSYGLTPLGNGSTGILAVVETPDPRLGSLFIEEDQLVGIDSLSRDILKKLVEGTSARSVISLVGEGGIGKTTLAKKVYGDNVVKGHFDCHAWITVSQTYNMPKLLQIMKKQLCPTLPTGEINTIEELIDHLRQYLHTKRYVVVFDDVWQMDFWEAIRHALPSNNKGSRIIIATRNSAIAYSIRETPSDLVQELKTLSSELAWQLFCKTAFRFEFDGRCPQELEQLSREIVHKCEGLPLVIVAVAGLLLTKEKVEPEWLKVRNNLNYEFETNPQLSSISKILSLSYRDLPHHLKSCFLYFGIFPEDYLVHETRLIKLWIAEGFVESRGDKTLEQVAKEYLNELICRNMVLSELWYGGLRMSRVHDLMRDMILKRADELRFFRSLNGNKSRYRDKSRRLSIYGTTKDVLKVIRDSKVRSVFLSNVDELSESFVSGLVEKSKLLKVLDFQDTPLENLPKQIGNLFHLKYLNLRGTKLKTLPKSIGNLHNLQALDVVCTFVRELPFEINKLQHFRHLLAYRSNREIEAGLDATGVTIHGEIGSLEELQTLRSVEAYHGLSKELEKLKKLKVLGIIKLTTEIAKALGAAIEKVNFLEELYMGAINKDEILDLGSCISSPPPFIRFLCLNSRLHNLPDWITKLRNLRGLEFRLSKLNDDPLKCLKGLPNLEYIYFYQTYDGEELHFEEGSFRNLKQLRLRQLEGLKVVKIDRRALPLLEVFEFGPSPLMKKMPSDVQHLTNLKSMEIVNMPSEFMAALQPDGGQDYWKIKHVPSVIFWHKSRGSVCANYKLGELDLLGLLQK